MMTTALKNNPTSPMKNSGFSLMEILISVIVLSIGLLGLTGLQIAAMKGTNESHFRNEASLLLMDTSNRMRSNREGMNNYLASISETTISVSCATEGIPECEGKYEGVDKTCSKTNLAKYDLNEVACDAQKKLPASTLQITKIANSITTCAVAAGITDPYYSLTLGWVETAKEGVASEHKNRSVDLNCFSLR